MQIKVVVVDFELPRWVKRLTAVAVPVLVLGTSVLARADVNLPEPYVDGDPLTAAGLNDRFNALKVGVDTTQNDVASLQADSTAQAATIVTLQDDINELQAQQPRMVWGIFNAGNGGSKTEVGSADWDANHSDTGYYKLNFNPAWPSVHYTCTASEDKGADDGTVSYLVAVASDNKTASSQDIRITRIQDTAASQFADAGNVSFICIGNR